MLESMFISEHGKHPLQSLVGELHDATTSLADQVLVVRLGRDRLVSLEPLAKLVSSHQPALYQEVQGAIHRGHTDLFAAIPELAANPLDREVVLRKKDHLGDEISLASDGLVVLPEMPAESLEERRSLRLIQASHWGENGTEPWKRTMYPAE
jgi:hypothetical protein